MQKFFLIALPLASLLMFSGCGESVNQSSSSRPASSGKPASATATQTAAAPAADEAQAPAYRPPVRNTTTQSLPAGWGYMHEQDLTGGRLSPAAATTRNPGI